MRGNHFTNRIDSRAELAMKLPTLALTHIFLKLYQKYKKPKNVPFYKKYKKNIFLKYFKFYSLSLISYPYPEGEKSVAIPDMGRVDLWKV